MTLSFAGGLVGGCEHSLCMVGGAIYFCLLRNQLPILPSDGICSYLPSSVWVGAPHHWGLRGYNTMGSGSHFSSLWARYFAFLSLVPPSVRG